MSDGLDYRNLLSEDKAKCKYSESLGDGLDRSTIERYWTVTKGQEELCKEYLEEYASVKNPSQTNLVVNPECAWRS